MSERQTAAGAAGAAGAADAQTETPQYTAPTLACGNLRLAVALPDGEDLNEWLAAHSLQAFLSLSSPAPTHKHTQGGTHQHMTSHMTSHHAHTAVDFFNQTNMLYGTLTAYCTKERCPVMCAGRRYEYHWADTAGGTRRTAAVSAPEYVDRLMRWVQGLLDDESVFPQKAGVPFPSTFQATVRAVFKRLFRVYAHVYYSHFREVVALGEEAHLNTSLKHFVLFAREFRLIEKQELAPLQPLIDQLCGPSNR